jgi:hypothetical protein
MPPACTIILLIDFILILISVNALRSSFTCESPRPEARAIRRRRAAPCASSSGRCRSSGVIVCTSCTCGMDGTPLTSGQTLVRGRGTKAPDCSASCSRCVSPLRHILREQLRPPLATSISSSSSLQLLPAWAKANNKRGQTHTRRTWHVCLPSKQLRVDHQQTRRATEREGLRTLMIDS